MRQMTDEQLRELGWGFVARLPNGDVASVKVKGDSDDTAHVMEWLGEGWTVTELFD